jgi:hypothetical protein
MEKEAKMFLLQKAWSCAKELQQVDCCRKTNTTSISKLLYFVALVLKISDNSQI